MFTCRKGRYIRMDHQPGITLAAALVSAFSESCVRSDYALTGEITLRGNILPVGGGCGENTRCTATKHPQDNFARGQQERLARFIESSQERCVSDFRARYARGARPDIVGPSSTPPKRPSSCGAPKATTPRAKTIELARTDELVIAFYKCDS